MKFNRKKLLKSLAGTACAVPAFFMFLPGCVADRIIFQPPSGTSPSVPLVRLEVEPGTAITLRYLPPPSEEAPVILYSHGNAEDLSYMEDYLQEFRRRGYGVAAYDYEGYGTSDGKPSEKSTYRDIDRVYRFLTDEAGISPERIVIYGTSVGGGPSCYLAEKSPAAALVLEAPFTSAFAVVKMGWLPGDRFRNLRRIGNIRIPVLIIHGDRDSIVPFAHGEALYEKANEPKRFYRVDGAGHNNIRLAAGERYWRELAGYLSEKR
mgnify:CR=1 FL=1|jgi:hypothetical protein